jgi:hypothetical protein
LNIETRLPLASALTPTKLPTPKLTSATGCPKLVALTPAPIVYDCVVPFFSVSVRLVALIEAMVPMIGLFLGPEVLLLWPCPAGD